MDNQTTTLSFETRLIFSMVYLILATFGVVLYIFDMYVMYKHRHVFNNTFYILVAYCAIGDIMLLLLVIFYVVPFSIANEFLIPESVAQFLANRLMAITGAIYPKFTSHRVYKLFVNRANMHSIGICCWIYGIVISIALDIVADCPKMFSLSTMTFGYHCADYTHPLFVYYATLAWVYPTVSFLLYVIMYGLLKKRAAKLAAEPSGRSVQGSSSTKREIMLLIQASIICASFFVETMIYIYLRGYGYWSDFLVQIVGIINSSINPIVYLVFNSTLRRKARETLGLKHDAVTTVQMTAQRTGNRTNVTEKRF